MQRRDLKVGGSSPASAVIIDYKFLFPFKVTLTPFSQILESFLKMSGQGAFTKMLFLQVMVYRRNLTNKTTFLMRSKKVTLVLIAKYTFLHKGIHDTTGTL